MHKSYYHATQILQLMYWLVLILYYNVYQNAGLFDIDRHFSPHILQWNTDVRLPANNSYYSKANQYAWLNKSLIS